MENVVKNFDLVKEEISNFKNTNIVPVSKTFPISHILPLINHGHQHFGENKVQEAVEKWTEVKANNSNIKLHLIGKLQTNKVKFAVKLFDYIHSVDSVKLAQKISDEALKINKKIKIFIQVNIGQEVQKSGINQDDLNNLVSFCKNINLDLIGLMCIPPLNSDPLIYFKQMSKLNKNYGFVDLSMGMSSDYLIAAENSATYLRIGSSIFGERS